MHLFVKLPLQVCHENILGFTSLFAFEKLVKFTICIRENKPTVGRIIWVNDDDRIVNKVANHFLLYYICENYLNFPSKVL